MAFVVVLEYRLATVEKVINDENLQQWLSLVLIRSETTSSYFKAIIDSYIVVLSVVNTTNVSKTTILDCNSDVQWRSYTSANQGLSPGNSYLQPR